MTFFEQAKQSELDMAIIIAFCIAAYVEKEDEAIQKLMKSTVNDIEDWLKQEVPEELR